MIQKVPCALSLLIPNMIARYELEGWRKTAQVGHKSKGVWLYFERVTA